MDKIKVEVTDELLDFTRDLGLDYTIEGLFGKDYLEVHGDIYTDFSRFVSKWKAHRENAPILDICKISSTGSWYCSVITNWEELDLNTQRFILSLQ